MAALEKSLRNQLERTVKDARDAAEAAARSALEQLGVGDAGPPSHLNETERDLRRRLRIHGRQLGDLTDEKKKTQQLDRLIEEVAYEHWHRMLFARFLAENGLLMYDESFQFSVFGVQQEPLKTETLNTENLVAISLDEAEDLAIEHGLRNKWDLAAQLATRMLPQIFRVESPVFEIQLPPEHQQQLEKFVSELPSEVFTASDSLGWVYQFWQARRKDQVNASEVKIGARELPAVTQLFTEDYMVDFLLDNTLGAWHAGKVLATNPKLAETAKSEEELRQAVALPSCSWAYLRFIKSENGKWTPAAGTFEGWSTVAEELKCLDPCMGSGHFVVAMFERLVALRMAEETLDEADAVAAVIRDNLFGLEIDPRCTQIAAFNVALAAWRRVGHCTLPPMNLACSGLAPNTSEEEWLKLAGGNEKLENGMASLYQLFQNAPVLGSLVNPRAEEGDLLVAAFHELKPLLEKALARETNDETAVEMAVTARGLAKAAEILAGKFTLVATNVPYLKSSKQDSILKEFCERVYPKTKSDLATVFIERCIQFSKNGGSATFVTPQTWLFLGAFTKFRSELLADAQWNCIARLGPGAFGTISGEIVNVALLAISAKVASADNKIAGIDADPGQTLEEKARLLGESVVHDLRQASQLKNPDARISFGEVDDTALLQLLSDAYIGQRTGDGPRFIFCYWELSGVSEGWEFFGTTVERTTAHGGLQHVLLWEDGKGQLAEYQALLAETVYASGGWKQGWQAWGKFGVRVSQMGELPVTLHSGSHFDNNCAVIVPKKSDYLPAIWAFCESPEFRKLVRQIDQSIKVTNATLVKVPFDLNHWKMVAAEKYPDGFPKAFSSDPTQWLFNGHPKDSDTPLQVAVARLCGYQWPRQTGSSFPDCPALGPDGLESLADKDGIVCIPPVRGEASAADRLLDLLAKAYGQSWSSDVLPGLLKDAGYAGKSLETWLRDGFFQQHCEMFHQRPFIWQIWDGLRDGFSALVNYHKLDRKNLETLIYTYLGDWLTRQSQDAATGVDGAQERLAAAEQLKKRLELILAGEAPYDIFVRWKPLHEQPIGWEPDINDGVRMNIRPFLSVPDVKGKGAGILRVKPKIKWDKDRGKEPQRSKEEYPWFWGWDQKTADFIGGPEFKGERLNDCHYSLAFKRNARATHVTGEGANK
jgi:hypothetical protein